MLLSCGDALFDLFSVPGGADDLGPTAIQLSGNVGGSPLNVAVGFSRLGHESAYLTKLSTDVFGQKMRQYIELNKLSTQYCIDTDLHTTLAIVDKNKDGSANYAFYIENTADVSITESDIPAKLPNDVQILHFGSYSTVVEPTSSSLITLSQREKDKRFISYDPNLRTSIEPDIDKWRDAFASFAKTATLIKASDEDIESLFGKNQEEKFVSECFGHGAQLVFITRGPDGCTGFTASDNPVSIGGKPTNVVDTVGAGDTFQATLLHYLAANNHIAADGSLTGAVNITDAMELAATAAAITCSRAGADLPHLADLG